MKAFGLTGNIGCGKSTVAGMLAEYPDVLVLDADQIAKEIIVSEVRRQEINSILGADVFPRGEADFRAIAKIIFEQPEKKKLLEELIHPLVWATIEEKIEAAGSDKVCIVESALIFETKSEGKFLGIIVATCSSQEQRRRLREIRDMSDGEIEARLASQMLSWEKERKAHVVIHTDGNIQALRDKVRMLHINLTRQRGGWS